MKVYELAHIIAKEEHLSEKEQELLEKAAILSVRDKIFGTHMGTELLNTMFDLCEV